MKCRALVVPRRRGEASRRRLVEAGALRTDLAIGEDGEDLLFPLVAGTEVPAAWGRVEERDFGPVPDAGPREYRDLLPWTDAEKASLPRAFDVVGDVVLIRLPETVAVRREEVGRALLAFVPGARVVGADLGVHGPERRRRLVRIAGEGAFATRHRENGLEFDVDLETAYFSPRLAREHALVAAAVRPGELVYDLCCGVGPFAMTIARDGRARQVVAVDANPDAVALLGRSLARTAFGGRVRPVVARVEAFLPDAPAAERVVLNLPLEGIKYLPLVGPAVRPLGQVHYYEVTPRAEVTGRAEAVVTALGASGRWSLVESHVVHPYSPASDLRAYRLERSAE